MNVLWFLEDNKNNYDPFTVFSNLQFIPSYSPHYVVSHLPWPSLASTSHTGHNADQAVSHFPQSQAGGGIITSTFRSGRDGGDEDQQADWRGHQGDLLPAQQAEGALLSALGPEETLWPQEAGPVSRAQDRQHAPCQLRLHPCQVS